MATGTAIYGSNTNGTGTTKYAFVAVRYNDVPNGISTIFDGFFFNGGAGNNMAVTGFAGAIVGEMVLTNASGNLSSTGTVYLLGRR
jgi:hypothetical protein